MARKNPVGAARERVLTVALELFARHGVHGTSLQMIADEIGVTKAAVYYQFRSKEEIVHAVVAPYLDQLTRHVEAAEGRRRRADRAETILVGIVDLVVGNRQLTAALQSDPVIIHLLRETPAMRDLEQRVTALLAGARGDTETLVGIVMVSGGLMIAATDPRLLALDDAALRHHLLTNARRLLRLKGSPPAAAPPGPCAGPTKGE